MKFDTEGTYTLLYTATDECGNETAEERKVIVADPVYGVHWNGSSNPKWTRTGLSANFADPQPAIANGSGSSPFDNIMPWSGMQIVEDSEAGTLVSIPKYWYKIEENSSSASDIKIQIANQPLDGFSVSPAHRDRGDGAGERDIVYVSRYFSASDYKSKTGVQPLTNKTRGEFRTGITALGNDIWQYDFSMYWTIALLYLVEYANWNSQAMIGYGCGTTYPAVPNTGSTDAMQYHTGTDAASREEYGNIQYRHIEGLWSGLYNWIDGVLLYRPSGSGGKIVSEFYNPSQYADEYSSPNTENVVYLPIDNGVPKFWRSQNTLYPKISPTQSTSVGDIYTEYSCDNIHTETLGGTYMILMGGLYASQSSGLFGWQTSYEATDKQGYIGSRLQKLPSA